MPHWAIVPLNLTGLNEVLSDFACKLDHGRGHGARVDLVDCLHAIWRKNIMDSPISPNSSFIQMTHLLPSIFPFHPLLGSLPIPSNGTRFLTPQDPGWEREPR